MKYWTVRHFLIEMKHRRSFGKVRSCIMFSPHHSLIAWKTFIFSWKKKSLLLKGCGERLLHSLLLRAVSVIASSFWWIYCRKLLSRLYQESLFNNTELILSEMVLVNHSTTHPSAKSTSNQTPLPYIMVFFVVLQRSSVKDTTTAAPFLSYIGHIKVQHLYCSAISADRETESLHSDLLHQETLEEVWTSVVVHCVHVSKETVRSQRQKPSCWDLGQLHPGRGIFSKQYLLRMRHFLLCCHCWS